MNIDSKTRNKYKVTIGIECHVQLKTKSKLFSGADNDARTAAPNTLVNHIDFGLPGALPVLNKEAVRLASVLAFALNSKPQSFSKFDRKHYFYPDLPMGYQITQYDQPIIIGGDVEIHDGNNIKRIKITRAHLEADAGKSMHPAGKNYSLVDLNRAGTPLVEIVSEPDMHSSSEAKAFVRELYLLVRYSGVSDANLYYGNMRFDVNVSVSRTEELGTRTETKNLNSFRSVEKAADYEINRQIELLEKGEKVVQQTRGWDEAKQKTIAQRGKEEAHDYRYMPDPDLPPVILDAEYVKSIESKMPKMPAFWRKQLADLGIGSMHIETLLEAQADYKDDGVEFLSLVCEDVNNKEYATSLANWFVNIEIPLRAQINESGTDLEQGLNRRDMYKQLYGLISENKLSSTNAKILLTKLLTEGKPCRSVLKFATENSLIQLSDQNEIDKIVDEVIINNPKPVSDIKKGEIKAVGYLVGQVMAHSSGQANPSLTRDLILEKLGIDK